jgi:excisionase family DNA binding protein
MAVMDANDPLSCLGDVADTEVVTVPYVARRLKLAKGTLYQLIADPDRPLPSIRIGRTVRIPVGLLKRYLLGE